MTAGASACAPAAEPAAVPCSSTPRATGAVTSAASAAPTRSTWPGTGNAGARRPPWLSWRPGADSVPGRLPDQHDVDASRQLLADLHDLPDEAVLAVRGLGPRVLQLQAVLVDPLVRGLQAGHD